jgi:uncharacterized protein
MKVNRVLILKFQDKSILSCAHTQLIQRSQEKHMTIVRPETASWFAISKKKIGLYNALVGEITLENYKRKFRWDLPLLNNLFCAGVLAVNNKCVLKNDTFTKKCSSPKIEPRYLVLKYTHRCNLKCDYCYSISKSQPDMNDETVFNILEKTQNSYGSDGIIMVFHGGESLLRFEDLQRIIPKLLDRNPKVRLYLQSNGTLITRTIASFLKNYNIKIGISVDGFNEITNSPRRFSSGNCTLKKVQEGMDILKYEGVGFGLLTVIHPDNYQSLPQFLQFYAERGLQSFVFNPLIQVEAGKRLSKSININELIEAQKRCLLFINDFNRKLDKEKRIFERHLSYLVEHLTTWKRRYMCAETPCGAARRMLAFDTDGSIFPCDNWISDRSFSLGNINNIMYLNDVLCSSQLVKIVQSHNVGNTKECTICPWKFICTSHCAADSYLRFNDFNHVHSMCEYQKRIIPEIISLLHERRIEPSLVTVPLPNEYE